MSFLTGAFLTRWGTGRAVPELASEVPTQRNGGISADGKTITWHLRGGLKWSDGTPLTSADIAFTVAEIEEPTTIVLDKHAFLFIERVGPPNPDIAVFQLSRPYGFAIHSYFGSDSYPIVPKHLLEGKDFNKADFWDLPS